MGAKLRPFLTQCYEQYGPVFQLKVPGRTLVVLAGPEANVFTVKEGHRVLSSAEFFVANNRELGVKDSMNSVEGELHRHYRKVEGRAYSRTYFADNLRRALVVAAEDLSALRAGDEFPVAQWCKEAVTEQLARMVVNGTARPYMADMLNFVQTALMVTLTGQLPKAVLSLPSYKRSKANIYRMVEELVAQHRQQSPEQAGRQPDLIDDVLKAAPDRPEVWGEIDIVVAAMGAFIAGMDTAANSLAFVLYRMHKHPEYLPELRAEADALFENGVPSAEQLGRSPLLHHFVMETMRLHPIAPAITRNLNQDVEFQGHTLRAGTQVIIGTTVAHGLEKCFHDPEQFDPQRFAAPRAEHRKPGAYAPFGVGTHTCAGSGMAEGIIMLNAAAILRTLEMELAPTYQLKQVARPTPSPDKKLVLRVKRVRHDAVSLLA